MLTNQNTNTEQIITHYSYSGYYLNKNTTDYLEHLEELKYFKISDLLNCTRPLQSFLNITEFDSKSLNRATEWLHGLFSKCSRVFDIRVDLLLKPNQFLDGYTEKDISNYLRDYLNDLRHVKSLSTGLMSVFYTLEYGKDTG